MSLCFSQLKGLQSGMKAGEIGSGQNVRKFSVFEAWQKLS